MARRKQLLQFAFLSLVTLVTYWPALTGGMLWDDDGHLTRASLESLSGLRRIWTDFGATQQYYPVLHSAFWIENHLWGHNLLCYHLANVALHCMAAILVQLIVTRLELAGAFLAALVFALHPINVQSVAWISEQKNTLSAVFYLSAAFVYLGFHRTRHPAGYVAATVLFLLALFSKTVTATLPLALLAVIWYREGELSLRRDLAPLAPWLLLGAAGGAVTAWVERYYIGANGGQFAFSLAERCVLATRASCFYLTKLVFPTNLIFFYPRWTLRADDWVFLADLLVVGGVAAAAWFVRKSTRGPLAALIFFFVTIGPALGFISIYPFLYSFVADHFAYLASLGVIVSLAVFAGQITRKAAAGRLIVAYGGVFAVVAALWGTSYRQASHYRSAEELYRHTLQRNPGSWICHLNYGALLLQDPAQRQAAAVHFRQALKIEPASAIAFDDLGLALAADDDHLDEAIECYRKALRLDPGLAVANVNLGLAFMQRPDSRAKAIAEFREAERLDPDVPDTHFHLANALAKLAGGEAEAEDEYRKALTLDPRSARVHNEFGKLLGRLGGRRAEAMEEFRSSIRDDPAFAEAYVNLGVTLESDPDRLQEAIGNYALAIRFRPDLAAAHLNLGNALVRQRGHRAEAITEYQRALDLQPGLADAHFNLANLLLSEPGRSREAIGHYEAALALRPNWPSLRRLVEKLHAGEAPPTKAN